MILTMFCLIYIFNNLLIYSILMNCEIVKDTKNMLADELLDIKVDKRAKTVIISGLRERVKIACDTIKNVLKV